MRSPVYAAVIVTLSVLGFGQHLNAETIPPRIVILISLDGFPAYAMQDERLPAPTLRALAAEGAVAEGMTTVNPTVTWPNHATLVTGVGPDRHFVLFNGAVVHHGPNAPVTVDEKPKADDLVKAQTIYDAAAAAGLVTAQVAWPGAIAARHIRWSFDETPDPDGQIARDLVAQGVCTREQLQHFGGSDTWRDEIYTQAALDILEHHPPSLLLLHLAASDMLQHEHGPHSLAADTAYAFEDDRVKQVVDAVRRLGLADRTTFLITSDHGFRVVHKQINLNVLLQQDGWAEMAGGAMTARAWTIPHGGVAMAYISDPSRRAELIPKLKKLFLSVEGVDHVIAAEDFRANGLPSQSQTDQSPDLFLTAKVDYFFDEETTGAVMQTMPRSGEHGYLMSDPDMNAIFIAAGAGVQAGMRLDIFPNQNVAPTIAKLLRIELPDASGHALDLMPQSGSSTQPH